MSRLPGRDERGCSRIRLSGRDRGGYSRIRLPGRDHGGYSRIRLWEERSRTGFHGSVLGDTEKISLGDEAVFSEYFL